ncbi:reverse transcriptase domain-containing protein [Pedobacter psychrotolerans]|uniref:reverse transcriptase domain-containing protein n=1 Tax=Pedobacter psychrotolerans TaxID=1843235 RepID=UPI003F9DC7ED
MEFLALKAKSDLLVYLDISEKKLNHLLYFLPDDNKYYTFNVLKRDGSNRKISSPNFELKICQTKIKDDLVSIYGNKSCVHGFVNNKNILTNAQQHLGKKILVNLDLRDFFSTIHFGRVRGMFLSGPFHFNKEIATLLAQICCYQGYLPQGAPTSPIISNFICRKLDNSFINFAKENNFFYTRYADDITFSSNRKVLSVTLGSFKDNDFVISDALLKQITDNGFLINEKKVRVSFKVNHQSVTGVKVNVKPNVNRIYIKQIRAILNACEKYGVEKAAFVHFAKNKINPNKLKNPLDFFLKRIVGKISFVGFIRGKDDPIFGKLYARIKAIVPNARLSIIHKEIGQSVNTTILTEGKTDWKHIKSALSRFQQLGQYTSLNLSFTDYLDEHKISNSELYKICEAIPKTGMQKNKLICVFDRDVKSFIPRVTSTTNSYKDWTNNVYSMVLPVPDIRNFDSICIEHYYLDEELLTYDHNNRRLFISTEFDLDGQHRKQQYKFTGKLEKLKNKVPTIIDSQVIDSRGASIALSKNDFANYIYESKSGFDCFGISAFKKLFDQILIIESIGVNKTNLVLEV